MNSEELMSMNHEEIRNYMFSNNLIGNPPPVWNDRAIERRLASERARLFGGMEWALAVPHTRFLKNGA